MSTRTTTKTETVIAYLYFTLALANFLTCFVLVCRQLSRHLKEPLLMLPKEPYSLWVCGPLLSHQCKLRFYFAHRFTYEGWIAFN